MPGLQTAWLRAHAHVSRLLGDRSGAASVVIAFSLFGMLGCAGLAVDVGSWYVIKRTMQGAADSAAYSAGMSEQGGASSTIYTSEARTVAANYGFTNGTNSVTVAVNSPPLSGPNTGASGAIEVIVSQPQPLGLAGVFLGSAPTVTARAVAVPGAGSGCVLTLDRGNVVDLTESGGTNLVLNQCDLYINSIDSDALNMSGGATITANNAYISGNYATSGGAKLNATAHTGVAPANDPYANDNIPSYTGCNQTNYSLSSSSNKTLNATGSSPYVFCNGLQLSGAAQLTLGAGIYVVDRGQLSVSGGATLTATQGTTIILTSSTGSNYATVSFSGGATINVTAPSSGSTAGLAFFQDRSAPSSGTDSFSGGSTQNITGAMYFPNQEVDYTGGSSSGGATCTQLVAFKAKFSGGATFNNSCTGIGVNAIGTSGLKLVE